MSSNVTHFPKTFSLKSHISNRQNLIYDQDLRFQVSSDCKGEPDIHAARVVLYWRVQELVYFGKSDDFIELATYFGTGHSQDSAIQEDIFTSGEFVVEARPD